MTLRCFRSRINYLLRSHWIFVGVSLAALVILSLGFTNNGPICTADQNSDQEICRAYPMVLVAGWHIVGALQDYSGGVIAIATIVLAGFTYRLWAATNTLARDTMQAASDQSALTRDALEISQTQFVASNRPRLVVRRVYWNDPSGCGNPVNGDKIFYSIANEGGTAAHVTSCRVTKWVVDQPYGTLPRAAITGHSDPGEPFRLKPGESRSLGFGASEEKLTTELYRKMLAPNIDGVPYWASVTFWLMGDVIYLDENATTRSMAFCRRYNPITRRFEIEADPDYEYSD